MRSPIRIATRGSKLALWQARHVKSRLQERYPGLEVELVVIKTQGDKILDVPLAKIGGKGLFVKEIEEALLDGRADLAVHSMKDVPARLPQGLAIGITPERERFTDTFLSREHDTLFDLPPGAVVGTSSLRRKSQTLMLRGDLEVRDLRGNLDTRVGKLMDGEFDAVIVATAGLNRLGLTAPKSSELVPPYFLPAVAQGALGIEIRLDDAELAEMLAFLDHPDSHTCVEAERGFLAELEGGCQVPIAAHAVLEDAGARVRLTGLVAGVEGDPVIRRENLGPADSPRLLGRALAREVLEAGGGRILDEVYGRG
jgi:hydroxymethylbilane synthase